MAAWTHCSWAYTKATASLIHRMRASNQSRPKGGEATATRPKFRNTGKSILKAEVTVRAATWPLTAGQVPGSAPSLPPRSRSKTTANLGVCLSFSREETEAQQSPQTWQSHKPVMFGFWTTGAKALSCTIYSTLPLSLKTDTLLVPTTDSQFWEDLSYSHQRIPKFKGKRDKRERYFCFNELLW